jgi:hypothetical protein
VFAPKVRARIARWAACVSVVAWPVTQFTVARHEPPFVLGLSWLAIILTLVRLERDNRRPRTGGTRLAEVAPMLRRVFLRTVEAAHTYLNAIVHVVAHRHRGRFR